MQSAHENLRILLDAFKDRTSNITQRFKKPKKIDIKVNIPGLNISGTWEVDDTQRKAAWELYVELVTRISIQELGPNQGLLREALTSLYNLFGETRKILRAYGPDIGKPLSTGKLSCGSIALEILNSGLRPVLSEWHPRLADYENTRPENVSQTAHEKNWDHNETLRKELNQLRVFMLQYADALARAAGILRL